MAGACWAMLLDVINLKQPMTGLAYTYVTDAGGIFGCILLQKKTLLVFLSVSTVGWLSMNWRPTN